MENKERKMSISRVVSATIVSSLLTLSYPLMAQTSSDLAKQAQNPIANMISLPLQNNTNFNVDPRERTQNILNVQPILPFSLSEDWPEGCRTRTACINEPSQAPAKKETELAVLAT